jgi:hypothetical protein
MTSYTATQAATKLGCNSRTIRRAAERLQIGQKLTDRLWIVSEDDLQKIAAVIQDGPGQPKKTT